MKKISYWARKNPRLAITLIVIIQLVLIALAVTTGTLLRQSGTLLNSSVFYIATGIMLLAFMLYPRQKPVAYYKKYYLRKTCDLMFSIAAFISVAGMANNPVSAPGFGFTSKVGAYIVKPSAEQILNTLKENPDKKLTRAEKRILKKEFNKQLLTFAKAKLSGDKEGSEQSGLILLTIIAALGIGFLLAGLVCSLSCNGSNAAAVAMAVVGAVGLIWGTVAVIKSIKKKQDKNAAEPATQ